MRAEALAFSTNRQNGDLETMELCWPCRTHRDFKPHAETTLGNAGSHMVGGTTKGAGGATDSFADDVESSDAGNNTSMISGSKVSLKRKRWRRTAPRFDAGLKEFTKLHKAQSREVKDADDATWI